MKTRVYCLLVLFQSGLSPVIAQQQPGAVSPEMQRLLSAFSGSWSLRLKFESSDTRPSGGTAEGKTVFRSGPGGRSMIQGYTDNESQGETSGMSVTWWDSMAQGYRAIWCSNKLPGGCIVMARLAKWENNDFVLGDEFTRDGKKLVFKEVVSNITPNSFTQTLSQGEVGKELKTIETIQATREEAAR